MALTVTLDGLIQSVVLDTPSGEVLDQLATASGTAGELGGLGDSLLGYFVDRCRRDGHSWAEIGGSLGVTKQAVQKRFVARLAVTFMYERFTVRARRASSTMPPTRHARSATTTAGRNISCSRCSTSRKESRPRCSRA